MKLEFELKKIGETTNFIQYEVLRKGLYYGLLSVDKFSKAPVFSKVTMEE